MKTKRLLSKLEPRIARTPCASSEYWDVCLTASGFGTPDDIIQLKHTDKSKFVMDGDMLNAKNTKVHAVVPYEDDPDTLLVYYINFDSHRVYTLKLIFHSSNPHLLYEVLLYNRSR